MDLFNRESFGPIVAVMPVGSDDDALGEDERFAPRVDRKHLDHRSRAPPRASLDQLEYGTVFMNRCDYLDPAQPWGGWKDSGRGVSLSALGFEGLTRPKSIHFRL